MISSKKFHAYIGVLISLYLLYIIIKEINITSIIQELRKTDIYWLFIALLFYWIEILFRILRWKRILVSVDDTIRYSSVTNSFCISSAANNIFPFRLGDILRAHLLGIQRNISRYSLMGTIVLEKLIDVAAVLLLACWGAFGVLNQLGAISKLGIILLTAILGIILLSGLYLISKNKLISNKLVQFFHERLGHFKKGFSILLKPKNLFLVMIETISIWTFNTLAIWAIIKSLGVTLSPSEVLLLEGITGLAAAIPSAPAGIGTLQYAFLLTFGLLQLDKSVGVAASLLVQGILLGSLTLVGMLVLALDSESRQALRRIRHE